jgi:hypothetical protein
LKTNARRKFVFHEAAAGWSGRRKASFSGGKPLPVASKVERLELTQTSFITSLGQRRIMTPSAEETIFRRDLDPVGLTRC